MEMIVPRSEPTPVTDREAMAKANLEETQRAHEMAARRRAEDAINEPPLINVLADSIKDKLKALPPEEPTTATE